MKVISATSPGDRGGALYSPEFIVLAVSLGLPSQQGIAISYLLASLASSSLASPRVGGALAASLAAGSIT